MLKQYLPLLLMFSFCSSIVAQEYVDTKTYTFHWGDISGPVKQNPQGKRAVELEVELETVKNNLDKPVYVKKKGQRIEMEQFAVNIYNPKIDNKTRLFEAKKYDPNKPSKFHGSKKLNFLMLEGMRLNIDRVKTKDGYSFKVYIKLKKDANRYEPPFQLPKVEMGNEAFEFQIISLKDKKSIFRIDTCNTEKKHLTQYYRNSNKYEIMHVPNFKTTRRMISNADLIIFPELEPKNLITDKSLTNITPFQLPEFTAYSPKKEPFVLHWGNIQNIEYHFIQDLHVYISEKRYSPESVKKVLNEPLRVTLLDKKFEVHRMRITFLPQGKEPISFITTDLCHPEINSMLKNISSRTSILFDEIFIKDQDDEYLWLPPSFMFLIK